jgi:ribosomal protein S18 acetylase RimI-like enzyme
MVTRFETNPAALPSAELLLAILEESGTSFPNWTAERLERAVQSSAVIALAWQDNQLVGFARAISDSAWCAYLSQLAVVPRCQRIGIGRRLIACVTDYLGNEVSLLVHSAEDATGFYEKLGFELYPHVYRLGRRK